MRDERQFEVSLGPYAPIGAVLRNVVDQIGGAYIGYRWLPDGGGLWVRYGQPDGSVTDRRVEEIVTGIRSWTVWLYDRDYGRPEVVPLDPGVIVEVAPDADN